MGEDERYALSARLLAEGHTQSAVAEAVGITARQLRRWKADGKLPEPSTNGANGADAGMSAMSGADVSAPLAWSKAEAERRKQCALARLRELEVGEREGRLLPRDDVVDCLTRIRQTVTGIARRHEVVKALADAADIEAREAIPVLDVAADAILAAMRYDLGEEAENGRRQTA